KHLAATCSARDPVREAIGAVAWPDDNVWPHDRRARSIDAFDDLFAACLEAGVRFVRDFLDLRIRRLRDRVVLVESRLREGAVDGNARDEEVLANVVLEQLRAQLDL